MRLAGGGIVRGVRGVGGPEVAAGGPALGGEDAVPEGCGGGGPGCIIGVIGDLLASVEGIMLVVRISLRG